MQKSVQVKVEVIEANERTYGAHKISLNSIKSCRRQLKQTTTANTGNATQKLMKMRYKVNFHVLLCFLSSLCSTTLAMMTTTTTTTTTSSTITSTISQPALSIHSEINSKTNTNPGAQIANSTFLTNLNKNNIDSSNNISTSSNSTVANQNHQIHLASSNDQSSSALVTNGGSGLKFQTSEFFTLYFSSGNLMN